MRVTTFVLAALFLAVISSAAPAQSKAAARRPNIVIILADDLGFNDVSFHGNEIRTPNIDRLARQGAELDRFYVCPVCSPTRAGLMTGRYPIRFGLMRTVVPPWREGGLDLSEVTLAEVLGRAGYTHRGIFGKWHLGHSSIAYHPLRRGFTEFVGHYNGAIDYFTHEREGELDWHRDYETNYDKGYSTDLIADAASKFIERRAGAAAPFFCYIPFNAPHSPFQAKQEDLAAYEHLAGDDDGRKKKGRRGGGSRRQILAAMISCMDQGVGRILDAIDRAGITDDTLVLFFSDNGGVGDVGDNAPLRGAKASVFEGGIRVAAAIRWPAAIPGGGRKITAPITVYDILPTIMRIVGVDDHGGKPLDGIDVYDVLTGKRSDLDREFYSFIAMGGDESEQVTVVTPQWKLIVTGYNLADPNSDASAAKTLLFRIDQDPNEKTDLSTANPQIVEQLMAKAKSFRVLQPEDNIGAYRDRDPDFKAPKEWAFPDR